MGKVRRLRLKYHNLVKSKEGEQKPKVAQGLSYKEVVSGNFDKINISSNSIQNVNSNVFSGIEINIDNITTGLIDDDRNSVRSLAKSFKYDANGKLLKKDEKRKLRHDLLMKRLDFLEKSRSTEKRFKKIGDKQKSNNNENVISKELPTLVNFVKKDPTRKLKARSIEKTQTRQKNMVKDISVFKTILSDPKFKANPFECISESVNCKLLEESKET